jgi:hypothetical protein
MMARFLSKTDLLSDGFAGNWEAGLYDGEVGRGRNGWVALADQDGYVYYFNDLTGATQWEKPEDY